MRNPRASPRTTPRTSRAAVLSSSRARPPRPRFVRQLTSASLFITRHGATWPCRETVASPRHIGKSNTPHTHTHTRQQDEIATYDVETLQRLKLRFFAPRTTFYLWFFTALSCEEGHALGVLT